MTETESNREQATPSKYNAAVIGVLLLALWIVGSTLILYPSLWAVEQFALLTGGVFPRVNWAILVAGQSLSILVPSLAGYALTRSRYREHAIFKSWILAAVFMLTMLPVRSAGLTDALTAAGLQILCLLVFLGGLRWWQGRGTAGQDALGSAGPAWLAAGLIIWPWVAWGALGSWLDTALNLIVALLFGLAAARIWQVNLLPSLQVHIAQPRTRIAYGGLVVSVMLAAMGAALGVNGQQMILIFLLPSLGWLVLGLAHWGAAERIFTGWRPAGLLVGLVAAAPLIFVDPDELVLALNLGSREVGFYALLATLISIAAALVLGLILWVLAPRVIGFSSQRASGFAIAGGVVLAAIYILVGQPGWHGERLFVIMTDQPSVANADLAGTELVEDYYQWRKFVYDTAVQTAEASQAEIRAALDRLGINYTPYYLMNALDVDAGPFIQEWLEGRPEVDRVLTSPELRPLPQPSPVTLGEDIAPAEPQWNLTTIGVPMVWDTFSITGAGVVVGQNDSGVDGNHPELSSQYRGNQPEGPRGNDFNWLDPWNDTQSPVDSSGHGTHTLGSVLGQTVGVAPDATWIGCVNLDRNLANPVYYLNCLQFLFAPFPQAGNPLRDGRPDLGAHIFNNSWGCPEIEGCDPASLLPAVQLLRAAGVFVVSSAGNTGDSCASINDPIAIYEEVFTIGAVGQDGALAFFSSRGPVTADESGRVKPDLIAPGVNVLSAYPQGTYGLASGTSMASPHVAGVVALMWSANPALIGDISLTEEILTRTAQPYETALHGTPACGDPQGSPDNATGYGIVDAYAAVQAALQQ
jgi:hypothetical protein